MLSRWRTYGHWYYQVQHLALQAKFFQQDRIGLHHVCFRARSKADVDAVHNLVKDLGATVVSPPGPGKWAPGYYYCLFEDPDGIRLEVNHVPGSGVLADDVTFAPGQDYR